MPKATKRPFLPEATFKLPKAAILLFRTNMLNYEFVAALNRACDLQLARVDDIPIESACHPCFSQYHESARLAFVLIEHSAQADGNAIFDYYDKMLIIHGRDAFDFQHKLYHDLTDSRPEPAAHRLLEHQHWQDLNDLSDGVIATDYFHFDEQTCLDTSICPGAPKAMPKQAQAFLDILSKFAKSTFKSLELHLCEDY